LLKEILARGEGLSPRDLFSVLKEKRSQCSVQRRREADRAAIDISSNKDRFE
jgi:hypothetical protein